MFHPGRTNERGKPLKSITVVLGLVGTVLRNADVVGLTPGQAGQFDAEVVQVQARHLLVEALRQAVDADRVPDNQAMESALLAGELGKVAENVYNVFDPVVTSEHLELNYIKSICNSYGALTEQMTGSGSAIFAILPSFEYAAVVCNMLKENYPNIYIAKPV